MLRVRFAPSPTGLLHQGNVRTVLFNYLFVKQQGGSLILRIDDTDRERSKKEFETAAIADLKWLGLDWEEGPDRGGPHAPYRQSERVDIYQKHLDKLKDTGKAYPCFCTHEDLEAERRQALAVGKGFRYSGKCRKLSAEERQEKLSQGLSPSYRFAVDREIVKFNDLVYGEKVFDTADMGDFILVRSDGSPLYLFTSAVDDVLMEISHVIRGEDGMSNTPRQILIQKALGFTPPEFAHLPLILGPDHTMLSKRNGSASVEELKAQGYLPQSIVNYLALLGWAPPVGKEVLSIEDLIKHFNLGKVSRSSAIFDWGKLNFINAQYMKGFSDDEYVALAQSVLQSKDVKFPEASKEQLREALLTLRPNVKSLNDLPEWVGLLIGEPALNSEEAKKVLAAKESPKVWENMVLLLKEQQDEFNEENYSGFMETLKKKSKVKGKKLFMTIRIALTGSNEGPELGNLFVCLGKNIVNERIQRAIANIQHEESK